MLSTISVSLPSLSTKASRVHSTSDRQHSETRASACVSEKSKTLKEVAFLPGCSSPKGARVTLQILHLYFHLDVHHCRLVDRLIVHIFHRWLVVWTALIEPMLPDPSEPQ